MYCATLLALASLRAALVALASNSNPHSIGGGGVVMPGCVVLVSNLNEKVCKLPGWLL